MKKYEQRLLTVIVVLSVFAALQTAYALYNSRPPAGNINVFDLPVRIGEWSARDVPVEDKIKDILETESVLMRYYVNEKNESVLLTVVHYNDDRVEFHLPERCSVGQGSDVIASKTDHVILEDRTVFSYRSLAVENYNSSQLLAYFFQSEDYFTSRYSELKIRMILNKLFSRPNSGALIKCSTPVCSGQAESKIVLDKFIKELVPHIKKYLSHNDGEKDI